MRSIFIFFGVFFTIVVMFVSLEFLQPMPQQMNTLMTFLLYLVVIILCLFFLAQTIKYQREDDKLPLAERKVWKKRAQFFLGATLLLFAGGFITLLLFSNSMGIMELRFAMMVWLYACNAVSLSGVYFLSTYYSENIKRIS